MIFMVLLIILSSQSLSDFFQETIENLSFPVCPLFFILPLSATKTLIQRDDDRIQDPTRISSVALANEPRSCKEETKRQLSPVRCTARREIVAKRICCPGACRVLVDHSTESVPLPIPERYIYTRRKNGSFNVWPTICTAELAKSRSMTRVLPPRIDSA